MVKGRDDFVIALRSAFFKKKEKQKFSLISLIILSIIVIIFSNLNFKPIQIIKLGINEVIYKSSYISSVPENKIKEIISKIKSHTDLHKNYQKELIKIENTEQIIALNNFLTAENKKLRELIDESINSEEIFARVLIDRESPFLKSIVLNKGSKDNVKIGMAIMDGSYLIGKIIEVNYTNSRALLLSDLNSKIPVMLLPDRIQAVVSGTGENHAVIEYTKEKIENEINQKDRIIYTSGLAGLFKSGIPVGRMFKNSNGRIDFFSKFTQLEYVKIVSFDMESQK